MADTYDDHGEAPEETPLDAVLAFVARTPAPLALFSMEDLLGVIDQPNMPGGDTDQRLVHHPNWLQQLPTRIEDVFSSTAVMERIRAINSARSRS